MSQTKLPDTKAIRSVQKKVEKAQKALAGLWDPEECYVMPTCDPHFEFGGLSYEEKQKNVRKAIKDLEGDYDNIEEGLGELIQLGEIGEDATSNRPRDVRNKENCLSEDVEYYFILVNSVVQGWKTYVYSEKFGRYIEMEKKSTTGLRLIQIERIYARHKKTDIMC